MVPPKMMVVLMLTMEGVVLGVGMRVALQVRLRLGDEMLGPVSSTCQW